MVRNYRNLTIDKSKQGFPFSKQLLYGNVYSYITTNIRSKNYKH